MEDIILMQFMALFVGFIGSRVACMLFDFFAYGKILWKVKYWIANKYGYALDNLDDVGLKAGDEMLDAFYDIVSAKVFIIGLLNCPACITIWTTLAIALVSAAIYGVSWVFIILSIIYGYLITEKL